MADSITSEIWNEEKIYEKDMRMNLASTASLIHAKSAMSASTKYLDIETLINQVPAIIDSM